MTIELAQSSAVYVDSNLFIYFIEKTPDHFERAKALFVKLAAKEARVFTSELTIAECLFGPARNGNMKLASLYEAFFSREGDVRLISLNGDVSRRAALGGGQWGLKLLDAIHYVSALDAGCAVLLTGDHRFRSGPLLKVLTV